MEAEEGKGIKGMAENVAGVVDWVLFINLGGRRKPVKIIKQEGNRIRSLLQRTRKKELTDGKTKSLRDRGQIGYHSIHTDSVPIRYWKIR